MKKLLTLLIGLGVLTASSLSAHKVYDHYNCGFYAGGSVGASYIDSNLTHYTNIANSDVERIDKDTRDIAATVDLFAGYLYRIPCSSVIIAPEIMGAYNSAKMTIENDRIPFDFEIKMPLQAGARVKFGYVFQNCFLAYAFLGTKVSHLSYKVIDVFDSPALTIDKENRCVWGLSYGLGLEYELKNCHRIGVEVDMTRYTTERYNIIDSSGDVFRGHLNLNTTDLKFKYTIPF